MTEINTTPLPAFAAFNSKSMDVKIIRLLNETDHLQLKSANEVYCQSLPIMEMFGILALNHQDLMRFVESLTGATDTFPLTPRNLNRLVLNYLASASALLDHFGKLYGKLCRANSHPETVFQN